MSILTEYDEVKEKKKLEYTIREDTRKETIKENKEKVVQLLMSDKKWSKEEAEEFVEKALGDN